MLSQTVTANTKPLLRFYNLYTLYYKTWGFIQAEIPLVIEHANPCLAPKSALLITNYLIIIRHSNQNTQN